MGVVGVTAETLSCLHPSSDVDALLALDYGDLFRTLLICRDIYHEGRALEDGGRGRRAPDPIAVVREILILRARFAAMTPEERARMEIGCDPRV
jgi:hypothetical protein